MPSTLYDKLWQQHLINTIDGQSGLLYVDRHLLHEVTSPQAFASLKAKQRKVRCPNKTFATVDHNVSTKSTEMSAMSKTAQQQVLALQDNCREFGIQLFDLQSEQQGIVHVMAPELGLTLPGMVVVCGDSHTSTHGAFGALSFGIGTSEVEHVLATQTLRQRKSKNFKVTVNGRLSAGVSAKDLILYIAGKIGHAGATGHVIEFRGSAIRELTMEQRMTVCNMSIELGAKAGIIAPDETTFQYLSQRHYSPKSDHWHQALQDWRQLYSDEQATFDNELEFEAVEVSPQVTWGTHPDQVVSIDQSIPNASNENSSDSALSYMALEAGTEISAIKIDKVFIGSCTNSRIEDIREVAKVVQGKRISRNVTAIVVPGSQGVKRQAEAEGLDKVIINAGFEWRLPGCSMCLAMNDDRLEPGERCASTSNRNFEGRQGKDGRTHLVSPAMAAAAALFGRFVDVRKLYADTH